MNEQKTEFLKLSNVAMNLEFQAELLSSYNALYELFLRQIETDQSDRYRAAMYAVVEQVDALVSELKKLAAQISEGGSDE